MPKRDGWTFDKKITAPMIIKWAGALIAAVVVATTWYQADKTHKIDYKEFRQRVLGELQVVRTNQDWMIHQMLLNHSAPTSGPVAREALEGTPLDPDRRAFGNGEPD